MQAACRFGDDLIIVVPIYLVLLMWTLGEGLAQSVDGRRYWMYNEQNTKHLLIYEDMEIAMAEHVVDVLDVDRLAAFASEGNRKVM